MTLHFLCWRQRWIIARGPKVSVIALRRALAPSIANRSACSVGGPRSIRSASSALQAAAFSIAPCADFSLGGLKRREIERGHEYPWGRSGKAKFLAVCFDETPSTLPIESEQLAIVTHEILAAQDPPPVATVFRNHAQKGRKI